MQQDVLGVNVWTALFVLMDGQTLSQFTSSDRTKTHTWYKLIQKREDCHVLLLLQLILITKYYKQISVHGGFKGKSEEKPNISIQNKNRKLSW